MAATMSSAPLMNNDPPLVKEPASQSMSKTNLAARELDENRIPTDKEDPLYQSKALPFAETDIAQDEQLSGGMDKESMKQSVSAAASKAKSSINSTIAQSKAAASNLGQSINDSLNQTSSQTDNILDRTMSQIRGWVQSFKNGEPQYEEYEIEVDDTGASEPSASSKLSDMKASASQTINQSINQAGEQAKVAQSKLGSLKDSVIEKASDVSQTLSQSINQYSSSLHNTLDSSVSGVSGSVSHLKEQVNDFMAAHPINQTLTENLPQIPSTDQIRDYSSKMLPPLAQQASSSWAFVGSFLAQYAVNAREFLTALKSQNVVLLMITALTFVNHFVLPWFFLDKSAARSVLYSYVIASFASHFTFFLSGHLRYMWLGHLLFFPMVMSLMFNQGFREAGDVASLIDSYKNGESFTSAFAAPLTLRSYLFVIWMRSILMNQALIFGLDLVNVMDLLGLSLDTQRGDEMPLIQSRVKTFRKQLAANIHGAADQIDRSQHRGHGRQRRNSSAHKQQSHQSHQSVQVQKTTSPQPQEQIKASDSQLHQPQQWVKKSVSSQQQNIQPLQPAQPIMHISAPNKSDDRLALETHEKSSNELRHRNVPSHLQ